MESPISTVSSPLLNPTSSSNEDYDFSKSPLRPAPLRLSRPNDTDCQGHDSKVSLTPAPEQASLSGGTSPCCPEPPASSRQPGTRLGELVTKFEILNARRGSENQLTSRNVVLAQHQSDSSLKSTRVAGNPCIASVDEPISGCFGQRPGYRKWSSALCQSGQISPTHQCRNYSAQLEITSKNLCMNIRRVAAWAEAEAAAYPREASPRAPHPSPELSIPYTQKHNEVSSPYSSARRHISSHKTAAWGEKLFAERRSIFEPTNAKCDAYASTRGVSTSPPKARLPAQLPKSRSWQVRSREKNAVSTAPNTPKKEASSDTSATSSPPTRKSAPLKSTTGLGLQRSSVSDLRLHFEAQQSLGFSQEYQSSPKSTVGDQRMVPENGGGKAVGSQDRANPFGVSFGHTSSAQRNSRLIQHLERPRSRLTNERWTNEVHQPPTVNFSSEESHIDSYELETPTRRPKRPSAPHSSPVHPLSPSPKAPKQQAPTRESPAVASFSSSTIAGCPGRVDGILDSPGRRASKISELCKVFDPQSVSSPFRSVLSRRRETAPASSEVTKPIMVSTTIAVTSARSISTNSSMEASVVATADSAAWRRDTMPESRLQTTSPCTPARLPRNKLKKKRRESPVKERISIFESLSHSENSFSSMPSTRELSDEASVTAKIRSFDRVEAGGEMPGPHQKYHRHRSRFLRKISASFVKEKSRKCGHRVGNLDNRISASRRHGGGPAKANRSFYFPSGREQARNQNMSSNLTSKLLRSTSITDFAPGKSSGAPTASTASSMAASSSVGYAMDHLAGPNLSIDTSFSNHANHIFSGRKPYPRTYSQPSWETDVAGSRAISNSFVPSFDLRLPYTQLPPKAPMPAERTTPRFKSRYPSSWGRTAGSLFKKSRASSPVVTTEESQGCTGTLERQPTVSWGRRAAAAAFGIGQRLKERERSGQSSSSSADNLRLALSDSPSAAPVVVTPQCGLQHPCPARPVNLKKVEALVGETAVKAYDQRLRFAGYERVNDRTSHQAASPCCEEMEGS